MLRRLHNLHRDDDGQTMVEFAIAFPVQLFLMLGIMQLAMIFVAKQIVNYAAFSAARSELVKDDLVEIDGEDAANQAPAKAAAFICSGISGPTAKSDITVTRAEYPIMQLPGWGLLLPPPPRTAQVQDPVGTEALRLEQGPSTYIAPEARSDAAFLSTDEPDKTSFAQAKTYVYRLDGDAWTLISGQGFAPDPGDLPMLERVRSTVIADDNTVVVAVAHDFEMVLPFVSEFYSWLIDLRPRLADSHAGEEKELPTYATATERWGAPHITLVDVGIQYRSWQEPDE